MPPTIVGLGGSLRKGSTSRSALQLALAGAATAGAETTLLDLRELDLPMYDPDDDEPTETAAKLIESCHAADGLLWSSPLYQMEFSARALRGWAVLYVVPIPASWQVFGEDGSIRDETVESQLERLGGEVVRVTERFAADPALHRQAECAEAGERVLAPA
jgi:FMN reductase